MGVVDDKSITLCDVVKGANIYGNRDETARSQSEVWEKKLWNLWQQESHIHCYDPFLKTVDFASRRPTDYKLNTRIILPKPLNIDEEFYCESRKRGYNKALTDHLADKAVNNMVKADDKVKVMVEGNSSNKKKKKKKSKISNKSKRFLNLSKPEISGLKSLK